MGVVSANNRLHADRLYRAVPLNFECAKYCTI